MTRVQNQNQQNGRISAKLLKLVTSASFLLVYINENVATFEGVFPTRQLPTESQFAHEPHVWARKVGLHVVPDHCRYLYSNLRYREVFLTRCPKHCKQSRPPWWGRASNRKLLNTQQHYKNMSLNKRWVAVDFLGCQYLLRERSWEGILQEL